MKIMDKAFMGSLLVIAFTGMRCSNMEPGPPTPIGQVVDSLNYIYVYNNPPLEEGAMDTMSENTKLMVSVYLSTEFVKRYYGFVLNMPFTDPLQKATDFFDPNIADGQINPRTGLLQFTMPSSGQPKENDILVFGPSSYDPDGHVAIVAHLGNKELEIVQQNPGPLAKTRESFRYYLRKKHWYVQHPHVVGWLRKP